MCVADSFFSYRVQTSNEMTPEAAISRPCSFVISPALVVLAAQGRRNTADLLQHLMGGEHTEDGAKTPLWTGWTSFSL